MIGRRAAAMLALLTIHVNQRVSVDALMDAVWGDRINPGSTSTMESHIWRLRLLLEPTRRRWQASTVLVNDAGGFRLVGGPSSIDSLAFAGSAVEVGNLLAAGDGAAAVRQADSALSLWRGVPYGGFSDSEWARPAVSRLDELRAQLQERRIEGLLATGALDIALSDLKPMITAMPFREHLRALEMEGLYRSGQGEQALQAYQETRRLLAEEVGIDPGSELQRLQHRILNNDPSLARPVRVITGQIGRAKVHLPPALTPLLGRSEVLDAIGHLVRVHRLVTIAGPAGCGKTRVAVEVARAAAEDFPDGIWFVDLAGVSDPALVVDVIVSTIGLAPSVGATPLEALRGYVQARRVLLVLDNCEHVLDPVVELLQLVLDDPAAELECCVLTTSREPLDLDAETVWTLRPLALPDTDGDTTPVQSPAVELFMQRLRAAAPDLYVDTTDDLTQIVDICVALDGLPLPLELAAARAATYTLGEIGSQVSTDPSQLGRLGRGPRDHRATLRSTIDWSHRLLSPVLQTAHRRLAVLPGPFTHDVAVRVLAGDPPIGPQPDDVVLDGGEVDDLLAQLVHRSMLSSERGGTAGRTTTFRQLATVRGHAQHALRDAGEQELCAGRRDDWVATHLSTRPPLGSVEEVDWYHVIDDNHAIVRAALAHGLVSQRDTSVGRQAYRLTYYWYYRERLVEGSRWLQLSHELLQEVGDPISLLLADIALGSALAVQGRIDLARPHIAAVLAHDLLETDRLIEIGEGLVGLVGATWTQDEAHLIVELHRKLAAVVERTGSDNLRLLTDAAGCQALFVQGKVEESVAQASAVRRRATEADNLMASWLASGPPMVVAMTSGNPADGIPWVQACMHDHLRFGTGAGGMFIETRANFAVLEGDYLQAARLYAAARAETRRAGMIWPRRELTHQLISTTRSNLSQSAYEQAWSEGELLTIAEIATAD